MGRIYNAVLKFLREDNWRFSEIEGMPAIRLGMSGRNGNWLCYGHAREEQQQFVFYSVCAVKVPEEKRQAMAEFLTRANYGMVIGNFEMDFSDGEIRCKTSIDVEGERLTSALIKPLIYANVAMMDRYLPGINAVIYGGVSPKEAVAQVEGR
ncbi:MAG: YbjN domain-containing protein [Acetobacteraceae bacterium]|nr:YbjN domain-containing protein [Acetobacteraceae bacterium]